MKKPSYIILLESGERLNINEAIEFNPNEYEWHDSDDYRDAVGLFIDVNDLAESFCFRADYDERFDDPEDGPTTATTIAFKLYDEEDNLLFEDEGGNGFWL